jgi:hypothetical protein
VENGVFALLQELGHRVVVQTVIAGGPEASFLHEARDRILGTILLPARIKATFGKDTEEMLRQRLTFAEAIEQFDLMPRTRIKRIRDELRAQPDALPLDGAEGEDMIQAGASASA